MTAHEMTAEMIAVGRVRSMSGRVLRHNWIVDFLWSGGMGDNYRATDSRISHHVAIKVLSVFQAEDGIRFLTVTGVQTCALPICAAHRRHRFARRQNRGNEDG